MIIEEKNNKMLKILILFYICSIVGYIYEMILCFILNGKFISHGILYGPWLPIYGTGSILIYCLNKFRHNKLAIFILSFFLTGFLEWLCGFLCLKFLGKRLWDYTGWFLNLNGHVCFLSAFIFGIGGLLIIYFLLPFIDKLLKKGNHQIIKLILLIISILFIGDIIITIFK